MKVGSPGYGDRGMALPGPPTCWNGTRLEDPTSSLFWTLSGLCTGGMPTNLPSHGIYLKMYICWGILETRCWKACIMFVNTLMIPFL